MAETQSEMEDIIYRYHPSIKDVADLVKDFNSLVLGIAQFPKLTKGISEEQYRNFRSEIDRRFSHHNMIIDVLKGTDYDRIPGFKEYLSLRDKARAIYNDAIVRPDLASLEKSIYKYVSGTVGAIAKAAPEALRYTESIAEQIGESAIEGLKIGKEYLEEIGESVIKPVGKAFKWGLIIAGAGVGLCVVAKILKGMKSNPLLMQVNPDETKKELYKGVFKKKEIPFITFSKAADTFYKQHYRYPKKEEIHKIPDLPGVKIPIVTEVGKVDEVIYTPMIGSRKSPYRYRHKMPNTKLVTDPSGKTLLFVGDTYLDKEGWLRN